MKQRSVATLLFLLIAISQAWAAGPEFDFRPPPTVGDAATPGIMRDVASRLIPVYQESDPERYLANLSALQMVLGDSTSADVSGQALRDRRRRADAGRRVGRAII